VRWRSNAIDQSRRRIQLQADMFSLARFPKCSPARRESDGVKEQMVQEQGGMTDGEDVYCQWLGDPRL
jgi:hypothetical protein